MMRKNITFHLTKTMLREGSAISASIPRTISILGELILPSVRICNPSYYKYKITQYRNQTIGKDRLRFVGRISLDWEKITHTIWWGPGGPSLPIQRKEQKWKGLRWGWGGYWVHLL